MQHLRVRRSATIALCRQYTCRAVGKLACAAQNQSGVHAQQCKAASESAWGLQSALEGSACNFEESCVCLGAAFCLPVTEAHIPIMCRPLLWELPEGGNCDP